MASATFRSAMRTSVLLVALALGTIACASDPAPTDTPASSGTQIATAVTTATPLPGEPFDVGPSEGAVLAVVGVDHDAVLDVHSAPGPNADIVATLDPLADDLVAQGESRLLDDSIWYWVSVNGIAGWVNSSFLQYLGAVDDVTSTIIAEFGSTPSAATMPDLGLIVAEQLASDDPPSRITMTAPASIGDLGEVTYDVVGLGDDSIGGFRLHVFGIPDDASGFVLTSVEQTLMCLRGVSEDTCV